MHRAVMTSLCLFCALPAAAFEQFVSIDPETSLFINEDGPFSAISVTYVQPEPGRPGANAGGIKVLEMDVFRLREDFRAMRAVGVRAIYMRIGAGAFLTPEGDWRRMEDPFTGVKHGDAVRRAILDHHEDAAAEGIGPFEYAYEVFDHLLDVAEEEGVYVVPMIMDKWSLPRKYDLPDYSRAIYDDELWDRMLADWRKILARYADRKVVLGWLIEGETFHLRPWDAHEMHFLAEGGPQARLEPSPIESGSPMLAEKWRAFLTRKHGDIETLRRRWGLGYDRARPAYDPTTKEPRYKYAAGVFDRFPSIGDLPLPPVERAQGDASLWPGDNFPYWLNVPFDPVWQDFGYFKADLYASRMREVDAMLDEVCPNHLFLHDASDDAWPVWHPFYIVYDAPSLGADVLLQGAGYTDAIQRDPIAFYPYESGQELTQTIAPYRPFAYGRAGRPIAYGMGEGGFALESSNPEAAEKEIPSVLEDRWITGILMDNLGAGSAFANIWDWGALIGATPDNAELHPHDVVASIATLSQTDRAFTHGRNARVLLLANDPTLHSLMKVMTQHNIDILGSALAATHRAFDFATTGTIAVDGRDGIDIDRYDAILIPEQFALPIVDGEEDSALWQRLAAWLEDKPGRLLITGLSRKRDAYFNPLGAWPPALEALCGGMEPGRLQLLDGARTWKTPGGKAYPVDLDRLRVNALTPGEGGEVCLTDGDLTLGIRRRLDNGSAAYFFGFPLGLAWAPFHVPELSGARFNTELDPARLGALFGDLLQEAGIEADYGGLPSLLAYVSDDARTVWVRQRYVDGPHEDVTVSSRRLGERLYAGALNAVRHRGGETIGLVTTDLEDNGAKMLTAFCEISLDGDGDLVAQVEEALTTAQLIRYRLTVNGDAPATFRLAEEGVIGRYDTPGREQVITVEFAPAEAEAE